MNGTLKNSKLVKGLTRPPMIFGVTLMFFVGNIFINMMLFIITTKIKFLIISFPLFHTIGYLACQREILFMDLFSVKVNKCLKCTNKIYHGKNSYDPLK